MNDALRQTSTEYDKRIESFEHQLATVENQAKEFRAAIDDLKVAKKIVDEQIDKLPKPKPPVSQGQGS